MSRMRPAMLAAAIALWGWQAGNGLVAAVAAMLLISPGLVATRWEFPPPTLRRIAILLTLLGLGLAAYLYFAVGSPRFIVLLCRWLPVLLLPIALMHAWGTADKLDIDALFRPMRRDASRRPRSFDPHFPYFALWLLAASASDRRDPWFFPAAAALAGWPLLLLRPRSYRRGAWASAFALAIALAYPLQHGLHQAQLWLEDAVPDWLSDSGSRTDPYRNATDIGHIGSLKTSDRIVLRVVTQDDRPPPKLFHQASYNAYVSGSWLAKGSRFAAVPGQGHWILVADGRETRRVTVHDFSQHDRPVLSLPAGTLAIAGLEARQLQRNGLGAVQIQREPGYFSYQAVLGEDRGDETEPAADDLRLPARERSVAEALAQARGLAGARPDRVVEKLKAYFAQDFAYSTYQAGSSAGASPLEDFLTRTRSGHCEYFATATVLLLRAAGVPARYATGYAVIERSRMENAWVVRLRHAHAWARAYVGGRWVDVDTTPADWAIEEAAGTGIWTTMLDAWSWLHFRSAQGGAAALAGAAAAALAPLAIWLGVHLFRHRRRKMPPGRPAWAAKPAAAVDSPFYGIERRLAALGWGRQEHESARQWLDRLGREKIPDGKDLEEILRLHNRARFDPLGLSAGERKRLEKLAEQFLGRLSPTRSGLPGPEAP